MRPRYFDFRMMALFAILAIVATLMVKIDSQNTLDARFYYSGLEAVQYFKSLSDKDSYRYLVTEVFDLSFIITYTALLFLSLKRLVYKSQKVKYLAFIPGIFDLVETSTIISVLLGKISIESHPWLGLITAMKWSFALVLL
ncbi:MAG: hypothetical protein AABY53_05970, partial [Bdellovibrionota bacterium]